MCASPPRLGPVAKVRAFKPWIKSNNETVPGKASRHHPLWRICLLNEFVREDTVYGWRERWNSGPAERMRTTLRDATHSSFNKVHVFKNVGANPPKWWPSVRPWQVLGRADGSPRKVSCGPTGRISDGCVPLPERLGSRVAVIHRYSGSLFAVNVVQVLIRIAMWRKGMRRQFNIQTN